MKINKGFLQTLAALQILAFHLWAPVTGSTAESFLLRTGYVGVDLFFLLSAYSLAGKEIDYKKLLKNRAVTVYGRFAAFAVIAFFINGWSLSRLLKILSFAEFFQRGGGSFLWFIPAIMLFYLLYPLFLKWRYRYKVPAVLVVWFAASFALSRAFGYSAIFIFTNRIGAIMAGYLLKTGCGGLDPNGKSCPLKSPGARNTLFAACIAFGYIAMYFWGFRYRLNVPFEDLFYIFSAFAAAGIAGLSAYVPKSRILDAIGGATLEIYAIQMVFGGLAAMKLYKMVSSYLAANIILCLGVIIVSVALNVVYKKAIKRILPGV